MDNQVFESTAERTFQYQSSLPPLPVPDLHDSLNKYLHAGERELNTSSQHKPAFCSLFNVLHAIGDLTGNICE